MFYYLALICSKKIFIVLGELGHFFILSLFVEEYLNTNIACRSSNGKTICIPLFKSVSRQQVLSMELTLPLARNSQCAFLPALLFYKRP